MFAEIITIGDELLIGQVVDTNSAWMAQKLNAIGIRVKQITSVSDNAAHIYKALAEAKERAEVVFITGGLGPTKDDITKSVLLDFFGGELVINEQALQNIHAIFARYNKPVMPANHQQAAVPSSCEIILNLQGTAPGMYFYQKNCHYFSMPGVPFEMIDMMENSIIPKLSQTLKLPFVLHETILTAGIGESFLADLIIEEEAQLPSHIQLAYLPKLGQVRLRLSAHGDNRAALEEEINFHKKAIAAKIADYVVSLTDINIEEVILQMLVAQKSTLATAESCTGGYIGHLLTAIPGSSKSYLGGGITYSYGLKEQGGMVDIICRVVGGTIDGYVYNEDTEMMDEVPNMDIFEQYSLLEYESGDLVQFLSDETYRFFSNLLKDRLIPIHVDLMVK